MLLYSSTISAVSAQAFPTKCLQGPLVVIYKKSYVMLHLGAEWTLKQNIVIADTRTRPLARF